MTEKNMTINPNKSLSKEQTRTNERYLTPAIDIFETEEGLTLIADVPGLHKNDLHIDINQGVLTLDGSTAATTVGSPLLTEFSVAGYYRQFRLPDSIDPDRTEAELNNGVLTLRLAKAEAAKPKKIEVKTLH
jgi:HSP20 family molecular chaperone IbpA